MDFEHSLTTTIETTFNISKSGTRFRAVFNATMDYLCKKTTHAQYHKALAATGVEFPEGLTAKLFRLSLMDSTQVLVNLRFYLFNLLKVSQKKLTSDYARETFDKYGLEKCDAVYCWFYVRDHRKHALRGNAHMKAIKFEDVQPSAIKLIHENIAKYTAPVLSYANKCARYRLNFVWRYSNESYTSLGMDLYIHALRGYKDMAPKILKRSDEHAIATMCRAVTNQTVNLQKKYSTHKHGRMINTGKDNAENAEYVLLVQSESQMRELEDGSFSKLEESVVSENEQSRMIRDIDMSVTRMIHKHSGTRRGALLNILFNRSVGKFFKFLRRNNHIAPQQKDVVDVVGRMGRPKFFKLVSKYLKVSEELVLSYVKELQQDLSIGEAIHA